MRRARSAHGGSRSRRRRAAVLLAGGDDRSMLAVARSLSRGDVSYVAVGLSARSVMGASRYLRPYRAGVGPDARTSPEGYIDFILDVVDRYGIELVFPLTDRTLRTCDRFRSEIEAKARLAAPPSAAVRNILDKRAQLETAHALGIPCPKQFDLQRVEQLPEVIDALGFPMVLKQPGLAIDDDRPRLDLGWIIVRDERELHSHVTRVARQGVFPVVQRFVAGMSRKLCCFAVGGRIVAVHQWRHIRTLHGISVLRETTSVTPELYRFAELLLGALDWEGMAHLEFKVTAGEADVRYMETNGRPWGAIEASIASGWDFPLWTCNYFLHGEVPEQPPLGRAIGKRARWHFGDLQVLLQFLAGAEQPSWTGRSRAGATLDYLSGFSPRIDADLFRLDDPLPELAEHARGAKRATYAVLRRLSKVHAEGVGASSSERPVTDLVAAGQLAERDWSGR